VSITNELAILKKQMEELLLEIDLLKKGKRTFVPGEKPDGPPPEVTQAQVEAVKAYFSAKGQNVKQIKFVNAHCLVGSFSSEPEKSFKITRASIAIQKNRVVLEQTSTPSELKQVIFTGGAGVF
jgi:hypothetical protein